MLVFEELELGIARSTSSGETFSMLAADDKRLELEIKEAIVEALSQCYRDGAKHLVDLSQVLR